MSSKRTLYLVAGIHGSGKTTKAEALATEIGPCAILPPFLVMKEGGFWNLRLDLVPNIENCKEGNILYLSYARIETCRVIYSALTREERDQIYTAGKKAGCEIFNMTMMRTDPYLAAVLGVNAVPRYYKKLGSHFDRVDDIQDLASNEVWQTTEDQIGDVEEENLKEILLNIRQSDNIAYEHLIRHFVHFGPRSNPWVNVVLNQFNLLMRPLRILHDCAEDELFQPQERYIQPTAREYQEVRDGGARRKNGGYWYVPRSKNYHAFEKWHLRPTERVYARKDAGNWVEFHRKGGKYDFEKKRWYIPAGVKTGPFKKWLHNSDPYE